MRSADSLGEWNGFVYSRTEYPIFLMTSFEALPSFDPTHDFEACGSHYGARYHLTGRCTQEGSHILRVHFSIQYSQEFRTKYFSGFMRDSMTIVGSEGWEEDPTTHQYRFILKRIPAEIMCRRPPPLDFRKNKTAALWRFARVAVLHIVRKRLWTWSYFAERRATREKLIDYDIRNYTSYGRPLDAEERARWATKRGAITAADASVYRYARDMQLKLVPKHM